MLAGGRSTRFGSAKLATNYHGRSLLERAVEALRATCDEVIVVVSPTSPEPDVPIVIVARDATDGEGPLAGLLAGLAGASGGVALVVGGDMPALVPAVLSTMIERIRVADGAAVALHDGDRIRPLPCVVVTDRARRVVRELFNDGERSLRTALAALDVEALDPSVWTTLDPERRTLFDVDEPGDLSMG